MPSLRVASRHPAMASFFNAGGIEASGVWLNQLT